jgi:hypothetical protein
MTLGNMRELQRGANVSPKDRPLSDSLTGMP